MKAISKTWWGADPVTLQNIFNCLVQSHLDLGAIILNPISQTNLKKWILSSS